VRMRAQAFTEWAALPVFLEALCVLAQQL